LPIIFEKYGNERALKNNTKNLLSPWGEKIKVRGKKVLPHPHPALSCPREREIYASLFQEIWKKEP
jgi:hypothetical protein